MRVLKYTFIWLVIISIIAPQCKAEKIPAQKGVCYVTWDKDKFSSPYSDMSLEQLSRVGVDHIALVVTYYQDQFNSTDIKRTSHTPSDKSLKHAIRKSRKLGLTIMLKPHIDLIYRTPDSHWRADIGFATEDDWKEWFDQYEKIILKYARIADRYNIEMYCVGTELSFTTVKEREWRRIISKVREVYDGKLIYAANWDNFKNIRFWDILDYVGIDAYFPLTYEQDPSLQELESSWKKWKNDIDTFHARVKKPIIFTEIGYTSSTTAAIEPWKNGNFGNAAPEIQARCYKAFFKTVWTSPWLAGVYWWRWNTNTRAGGPHNRQYTPQNKPAERIMERYYKNIPNTGYMFAEAGD